MKVLIIGLFFALTLLNVGYYIDTHEKKTDVVIETKK